MLTEYSSVTVLDVTAPVAPARAATPATGATSDANSASSQTDTEFRLFGNDGFTFSDLMDIINPLQHIPVVSSIYRSLSGDEIDPGFPNWLSQVGDDGNRMRFPRRLRQ